MSDQQAPQSESAIEEPREKTAVGGPVPTAASTGDEILERMATIRMHIEEHSVEVMTQTEALSDWRFYVRCYPWFSVTAAAAVGYTLVPRRGMSRDKGPGRTTNKQPAAFSAAELRSALTGAARRAAMTYASKRLDDVLGRFFADDGEA